ncbi:MAG: DUF721 domain-containing protein [Deltaproteobacteria bacterium]|nr:DUF721 domain-containing protein [Deltaproteobacteria bacterium]
MSRYRKSNRMGIGRIIRQWVKKNHWEPDFDESLLSLKWSTFVGDRIGAHTRPRDLKGGVLTVIVGDSAWLNELSYLRRELIAKVNRGLGRRVVKELRLLSGVLKPSPKGAFSGAPQKRVQTPQSPPDEALVAQVLRELPEGLDPELADVIARARAAQLTEDPEE